MAQPINIMQMKAEEQAKLEKTLDVKVAQRTDIFNILQVSIW